MKKQALNPSSLKILGGAGLGMLGGAAAGGAGERGAGSALMGGLAGAAGGAALGYAGPRALAARKAGLGLGQTAQMLKQDVTAHGRAAMKTLTGPRPVSPASPEAFRAASSAAAAKPALHTATPTQVEGALKREGMLQAQLRQIRGEPQKIPLGRAERRAARAAPAVQDMATVGRPAVSAQEMPTAAFKAAASKGQWKIPQSRSGRRSMRVSTLLKKEKDGSLYKRTKEASSLAAQMPVEYEDSDPKAGSPARGKKYKYPTRSDTVGYPAVEGPLPFDVVPKQASDAFQAAFIDELCKLAGVEYAEKVASELDFEELLKEARFRQALQSLKGFVTRAPKSTGVLDPSTGKEMMLSMRGGGHGLMSGIGKSLEGSGKTLRTAQSVPGAAAPSAGARVLGGAMEGAGHHVDHRSALGLAINPLGVPLGGAIEGGVRQAGKELQRTGKAVATGVSGAPTLGGGARGSLGRAMERHAGKAGLVGEVGGIAGLGTAVGAPISAIGAIGGKMTAAAPLVEHALHGAGEFAHHLGADVIGGGVKGLAARGGQVMGRLAPIAGKALGRVGAAAA